ncbi:MAG TPA: hypothetical protein PKC98_26790, partial [Candidatus Melainabacteria bacterium]|nr:hypothetical protein [Candidatus Melainabacteria bacterium]
MLVNVGVGAGADFAFVSSSLPAAACPDFSSTVSVFRAQPPTEQIATLIAMHSATSSTTEKVILLLFAF